jgi:putative transposase
MPNYRRAFVPGGCYFFTVNLRDRISRLLTDHIEMLRDAVRITRRNYPLKSTPWSFCPIISTPFGRCLIGT